MIICPRCTRPLPDWLLKDSHVSSICPQCQSALDVYCFPALYRAEDKLDGAPAVLPDGDASCYEHSSRPAHAVCSQCGRFLCELCEVPLGHEIFCPDCLSVPQRQKNSLDLQRTKYDSIALALATWPILTFYFVIITAPMAFVMALFAWNRPLSIVRQSRWRIYLAMALSALEMAGIAAFIVFLVTQLKGRMR